MINKIWSYFIITGILYSIVSGNINIVNNQILESTKVSLNMVWEIFPITAMWLGLMNVASKSGLLNKLSKMIFPIVKKLFKEIPENHESSSLISTNIIANIFGLGSAATPIGLKAMHSLKDISNHKDEASNSMITFLALNTSGLTIIPTTIISMRIMHGSNNPTEIVLACIIATFSSTIIAVIVDVFFRKVTQKQ